MHPSRSFRYPPVPFVTAVATVVAVVAACSDGPSEPPPAEEPTIASVTPSVLRPGVEATLEGSGFAGSTTGNAVEVWGSTVTVLEASATSIRIRLPDPFCAPEGDAPIRVTANGEASAPFHHPYESLGVLNLEVGEFLRLSHPEDRCIVLPARSTRADYLVGTQSTTSVVGTVNSIVQRGIRGGAQVGGQVATAALVAGGGTTLAQVVDERRTRDQPAGGERLTERPGAELLAAHRRAELEIRRQDRAVMVEALRGPRPAGLQTVSRVPTVPGDVQPGDTVTLNVPDVSSDNFCQQSQSVNAVVRRVGTNSIWLEDVENPEGGFTPADYDLLSDEFDNDIYEVVTSYFGEPTDLDDNGRVVILITEQVNRMTESALGFVLSVDFFPSDCPAGNGGEYYYAKAPDPDGIVPGPNGTAGTSFSREDALSLAPLLLAHEVTHIIQFGRRFQVVQNAQERWILEGQATLAEEVVGHHYSGNQTGMNLNQLAIFTEGGFVRRYPPTEVPWYANGFFGLFFYFGLGDGPGSGWTRVDGAPHECTWFSVQEFEPCDTGLVAYGTTWSFLRWMSDHFGDEFPGGERELQRRIVDSPRTGLATFEDLLGTGRQELLGPWAASLYADGRVVGGTPDPLITMPSWDLGALDSWIIGEARLLPTQRSFSGFQSSTVQVAAGSSHYTTLQGLGGHPPFALSARTSGGGPLPEHIQLWVVRLR